MNLEDIDKMQMTGMNLMGLLLLTIQRAECEDGNDAILHLYGDGSGQIVVTDGWNETEVVGWTKATDFIAEMNAYLDRKTEKVLGKELSEWLGCDVKVTISK